MEIRETLQTPVVKSCDVLVAGGGIAGIAAALAAARQGKKVILLERGYMLGGLATAGLVTIYLPLCDGMGRQVSFSIAEELLRLSISIENDGQRGAANWLFSSEPGGRNAHTPRFEVNFNPQLMAISAEQLLLSEKVEILYGTSAAGCVMSDSRITHIVTESVSGRQAIAVGSCVDASGDCVLAALSGAPTVNFRQGNILASWYYYTGKDGYRLNLLGFADIPDEEKAEHGDTVEKLSNRRYAGIDNKEVSDFVCASHASIMNDVQKRRAEDAQLVPVTIATIPQLRMTRRLDGEYTLASQEMHKRFEDSIGMVSDWRKRGPVYEVPFRTLYSSKVKNLICAGRITSVTEGMWDIMRVIPCCAVTGEAAGIAAAMSDDFSALDISQLQERLCKSGVILHEDELC